MKPGPRKTPAAIKNLRRGTFPKPGAAPPVVKPSPDVARMPRGILGDHGKALWRELAPLLAKAGLLTELDRPALTMTCLAWQHAIEANKLLDKGLLLRGTRTDREVVKNPAWSIFAASMAGWRQWASEFGLTPAARASIEVTTLESEGMTLAEMLFASIGESPSEDGG